MQDETRFKQRALRELRRVPGLWVVKVQQRVLRGIPDLLGCVAGRFFAWELKTSTGTVEELQRYHLDKIQAAGGISEVVTPETLDEKLAAIWQVYEMMKEK